VSNGSASKSKSDFEKIDFDPYNTELWKKRFREAIGRYPMYICVIKFQHCTFFFFGFWSVSDKVIIII